MNEKITHGIVLLSSIETVRDFSPEGKQNVYDPWGKSGAGAPIKDPEGQIQTRTAGRVLHDSSVCNLEYYCSQINEIDITFICFKNPSNFPPVNSELLNFIVLHCILSRQLSESYWVFITNNVHLPYLNSFVERYLSINTRSNVLFSGTTF